MQLTTPRSKNEPRGAPLVCTAVQLPPAGLVSLALPAGIDCGD
ncbi:unnamed protein product, partial [Phaeothamnion confervicola]